MRVWNVARPKSLSKWLFWIYVNAVCDDDELIYNPAPVRASSARLGVLCAIAVSRCLVIRAKKYYAVRVFMMVNETNLRPRRASSKRRMMMMN
jgi:hypothetical protein